MLDVAALNLAEGHYGSAINRAYYAIFYAAVEIFLQEEEWL